MRKDFSPAIKIVLLLAPVGDTAEELRPKSLMNRSFYSTRVENRFFVLQYCSPSSISPSPCMLFTPIYVACKVEDSNTTSYFEDTVEIFRSKRYPILVSFTVQFLCLLISHLLIPAVKQRPFSFPAVVKPIVVVIEAFLECCEFYRIFCVQCGNTDGR